MSLLNFKSNGSKESGESQTERESSPLSDLSVKEPVQTKDSSLEIPEHIFIETPKPKAPKMTEQMQSRPIHDVQALYKHLEQNFEKKGYEDALINPDTSYMEENVLVISNDLKLLMSKIKTYYSGHLRNIDFHIETRKRSGMLETVDELISYKQTVLEEINIVAGVESDSNQGIGLSQNLILGYKKGFRNGFAAITYNTILARK